ncbi:MAG TPA: hypothetical protein VF403_25760 [Kofleriaceae bacterium]
MADLTLRLRVDPKTGRREIVIDYSSDSDALPFEHEEEHRQLAEKVVNGGLKNNPKVEVSREEEAGATEAPAAEQPTATPTATKA